MSHFAVNVIYLCRRKFVDEVEILHMFSNGGEKKQPPEAKFVLLPAREWLLLGPPFGAL